MGDALLVLNFKAYFESIGEKGLKLAKIAGDMVEETGANIVVCPQNTDLRTVASAVKIPVFAQHVDAVKPGSKTGHITPEAAKDCGCGGTLINHSEHRIPMEKVKETVERCKEAGLLSLVCVATPEEAGEAAAFNPDFIAIEPPELIGSGISVSTANPKIVTDSVDAVQKVANVPVLCGAGISNGEDIKKAVELGARGVLLASAFVKAEDPAGLLKEMAAGL